MNFDEDLDRVINLSMNLVMSGFELVKRGSNDYLKRKRAWESVIDDSTIPRALAFINWEPKDFANLSDEQVMSCPDIGKARLKKIGRAHV